jgi:mevalonate pyrophosphate decarboxylase
MQSKNDQDILNKINNVLAIKSARFALVSMREIAQGLKYDYSFQVKLKSKENQATLVGALKEIAEVDNVTYLMQQTNLEI